MVYYGLTEAYFCTKFEKDPNYDPEYSLVAEVGDEVIGFINGISKRFFWIMRQAKIPRLHYQLFCAQDYRGQGWPGACR